MAHVFFGLFIQDQGKGIDPEALKMDRTRTGVWRAWASALKRSVRM